MWLIFASAGPSWRQAYQPDQDAIGSRHDCVSKTLLLEVVGHVACAEVRPESHRSGVHHLLDGRRGVAGQRVETDEPQDDAIGIDDDKRLVAHPIAHVGNPLAQLTCRNVALRNFRDYRDMCLFPRARQPRSEPVSFPGLIPVDVCEAEANEPRRGPCAHISLLVVAVRNDWLARVQPLAGFLIQCLERDVDGARDVFPLVLTHGEDIHELGALLDELL